MWGRTDVLGVTAQDRDEGEKMDSIKQDSGSSLSLWMKTAEVPNFAPLEEDVQADVCVVGAGIAGLTTAYTLTKAGRRVVVLDDGPIGGGNTVRTTAQLSNAVDDRYSFLERAHGQEGARLAAESHTAAISFIERVSREEGIDCDFERLDGYLFAPPGDSRRTLDEELRAAHRAGLEGVTRVGRAPIAFDTMPCLKFPNQAQFDPMKYLVGLAKAIEAGGGRIYAGTHATSVEGGENARVETGGGHTVRADAVVVATNTPVNDRVALHTKQAPYTTYVVGLKVPKGAVTKAFYWDTLDPYHYVRLQDAPEGDFDVLLVGGEDHKTGQADDAERRFGRLEAWTQERFPETQETLYRWSGMVLETDDGLAFIGRNPGDDNVFIATGDSGMGMTHGTIAGTLLKDLIVGRDNPWAALYDPARKPWRAPEEFVKENLNVAAQYMDLLTGGEVRSADAVLPGSGATMRRGLSKVALYRDEAGALHERSAICPHLGCVVAWNSFEKTWDCPCHGSRFDALGRVINGPANRDLAEAGGEG